MQPSVPFFVAQPSFCLCSLLTAVFGLRYAALKKGRDLRIAACAFVPTAGAMLCMAAANAEGALISTRYDLYVYHWDQAIGGEPAFALGRALLEKTWGLWFLNFAYGLLGLAVAVLLMGYAWKPSAQLRQVAVALLLNFLLAPALYALFPVSGPRFAFPSFPAPPAWFVPHVLHFHAAPNGVPSVHCSTALLVWWYGRRWRVGGMAALVHLALVVVSTLASGQHYLFDLIVAIPYSIGVVLIAQRFGVRQRVERVNVAQASLEAPLNELR